MLHDLQSALDKFEAALSPAMKKFLDRLPRIISAKAPQAKRQDTQTYQTTAKLLEASVARRVVSMRYHSQESGREKEYLVHPHRLVHAQGGLYLIAFVPAYSEVRTFAIERVRRVTRAGADVRTRSPSSSRTRSRTRSASIAARP